MEKILLTVGLALKPKQIIAHYFTSLSKEIGQMLGLQSPK